MSEDYLTMPGTTPAERWARVQAYVAQVSPDDPQAVHHRQQDARDVYWHVYGEEPPDPPTLSPEVSE